MAEKDEALDLALPAEDEAPASPPPPRRSLGHRGADVRDTVAEMTARAHEISLEAGSKMTGVIRDIINAAAGLADFATESARDLVQYMVRRGQMSLEDGERLLRDAEEAQARRKSSGAPAATPLDEPSVAKKPVGKAEVEAPSEPEPAPRVEAPEPAAPPVAPARAAAKAPTVKAPAVKAPARKVATAKPPAKPLPTKAPAAKSPAVKPVAKPVAKRAATKVAPAKAAAKKAPAPTRKK